MGFTDLIIGIGLLRRPMEEVPSQPARCLDRRPHSRAFGVSGYPQSPKFRLMRWVIGLRNPIPGSKCYLAAVSVPGRNTDILLVDRFQQRGVAQLPDLMSRLYIFIHQCFRLPDVS